ncbi:OmpH family outer membrane protein [Porphyromonas levii]|uniref:OmpH family outer membrane protein n=1 Tax=Porphyromonas levii TaxID=28114 RepID=A0A4Y8WRW5_9PORP|nr:OmpH family outer membrane protein [Porphyromonas levii]MBR8703570.1 Chaperone protein Skp [Porphyromonas levii]MBR8712675.1 Chaperone protein Skp [Porphyromonas levii]MBR8714711.1 Chaperone protein Skp [Porphyromonas levii]MBR8727195.1 Chaperone protein Skp [Porphyromonas levii]MBR8729534.1 Chaperone protein Skp [Porphyromonas levii]
MKKILLSLVALMAMPLMSLAQEQKIAVVDVNSIIMQMPETKAMQTTLDNLLKKYEDTHVAMQEEFQKKYEAYEAEREGLLETIRTRREQELQDQAKRIQDLQQVAQQDYQKKQVELLTPIQKKIQDAIAAVGNENGYTYIVDAATVLFMNNSTAIDATTKVKAKLGM